MSVLLGHAKAARALGDAFGEEAADCEDGRNAALLARIGDAYTKAGAAMEERAKQEAMFNSPAVPTVGAPAVTASE